MKKKRIVIALGHEALGTTLPEQKKATKLTAKAIGEQAGVDNVIAGVLPDGKQSEIILRMTVR